MCATEFWGSLLYNIIVKIVDQYFWYVYKDLKRYMENYIITTPVHFFLYDSTPWTRILYFSFPYSHTLLLFYVYDLEQRTLF